MRRAAPKLDLVVIALLFLCGKTTQAALAHPLDCQGTIDREGVFLFVERGPVDPERVCLSIIKAPTDRKVEVRIQPIAVPCGDQPELAFVDGLNLNNDFFPGLSEEGPPMSERMRVLCSSSSSTPFRFVANQNIASVLFRFSRPKRGFKLYVRFVTNPKPCNIIAPHPNATGELVLSNFGERRNCSLLVLYPTEFLVLRAKISGGRSQCPKPTDYYEIRSGFSVDPMLQTFSAADSCALTAAKLMTGFKGPVSARSPCFASVFRLVSSGKFNNAVLIRHRPMDLQLAERQCPME